MANELLEKITQSLGPAIKAWEKLKIIVGNLNPREKIFVSLAGGIVLLLVIDLAIVVPVSRRASRLERQIEKAQKDLKEMSLLGEEHKKLADQLKGLKPIPKDFSFLHHLESLGTQSGVKIDSIKPGPATSLGTMKEVTYEVKIEKVSLYQLVDLLFKIENNQDYPMQVKRITIRPQQRDRQYLEVSFQVLTMTEA